MHMDRSGLPAAAGSAAAARSTVAAALAATLLLAGPTAAGTFAEVTGFGSNPGALKMFTYLPDTLRNPAPLVVVMHGCNQNAADYLAQSGWREAADADGFVLLLPEQRSVNHPTRCLNFAERRSAIRTQRPCLLTDYIVLLGREALVAAANGAPVFLLTSDAGFYYLVSGIRNPTPIDYPLVASMGRDGEERLIAAIRSRHLSLVCVRPFPDPLLRPARLEKYVQTEMHFVSHLGFCDLYQAAR